MTVFTISFMIHENETGSQSGVMFYTTDWVTFYF